MVVPKTLDEIEALKRSIMFVPCRDKRQLQNWIRVFLELEMPDSIVDVESNCTPMDMVWECYSKMLNNDDPNFRRVLYYASREGGKTLGESVIEVLCLVHLHRDVIHLAALKEQSWKAQEYVKDFLGKPLFRDYVQGNNKREVIFIRYVDRETGETYTEKVFEGLSDAEKARCECIRNYVRIIVATMESTNGQHSSVVVLDECDLMPAEPYEEAKMIATAGRGGRRALTILGSTRKYSFGLVQKEIDNARDTGLIVKHWNILDVTEACPPERHRPEEPRVVLHRSSELLRHMNDKSYQLLSTEQKFRYVRDEGAFAGCEPCKLYPMCRGRLATEQKTKRSDISFVKEIDHVIAQFRTVSLPKAKAQLLCWKPSSEGLIYPQFDRDLHMLTASQMATRITGDKFKDNLTKLELIAIMKAWDMRWGAGMDFGYSHRFAVVMGATTGYYTYVLHCISEPGLDPTEQVEICKREIKPLDPKVFADPENPQMISTMRKSPPRGAALRMPKWIKGPGSVLGGIDIVRMLLRPAVGDPRLFLLKDDEGCELLAKRFASYHWKINPDGSVGKQPEEEEDDECDALRYWLMNEFAPKGTLKATPNTDDKQERPGNLEEAGRRLFRQILLDNGVNQEISGGGAVEGKGSIKWSIG